MPPKFDGGFDFETMAVVLYAMLESGVTLGNKHYDTMSAADGSRGRAAFEHQFRKVKARAKALQDKAAKGELSKTPVKTAARAGGGAAGGGVKKSGGSGKRKNKADTPADCNEDDECEEVLSPSKRARAKAEIEEDRDEVSDGGAKDDGYA
ncbi:hypothetical protein LTR62_005077 [Meristemomyces frigidus]|uniref:Uncharacterized protein n=1 Tax=Meristemomyces frigidus TaxID=1508187 RepID=A0AAN7TR47_9PEZI|nr:hypothetical protein LTR62_005077 [Meristemomyces frigidus]